MTNQTSPTPRTDSGTDSGPDSETNTGADTGADTSSPPQPFDPSALEEWSVYAVNVKHGEHNPRHAAILMTGYDTGAYAMVYNNTYDRGHPARDLHTVEVVRKLTDFPHGLDSFPTDDDPSQ